MWLWGGLKPNEVMVEIGSCDKSTEAMDHTGRGHGERSDGPGLPKLSAEGVGLSTGPPIGRSVCFSPKPEPPSKCTTKDGVIPKGRVGSSYAFKKHFESTNKTGRQFFPCGLGWVIVKLWVRATQPNHW